MNELTTEMIKLAILTDCSPKQDKTKFVLTMPNCQPLIIIQNSEDSLAATLAGNFDISIKEATQIAHDLLQGFTHEEV